MAAARRRGDADASMRISPNSTNSSSVSRLQCVLMRSSQAQRGPETSDTALWSLGLAGRKRLSEEPCCTWGPTRCRAASWCARGCNSERTTARPALRSRQNASKPAGAVGQHTYTSRVAPHLLAVSGPTLLAGHSSLARTHTTSKQAQASLNCRPPA